MGFLSYIKYSFCDLFDKVRCFKWKFVLCAIVTVIGFVLGIVFFSVFAYGWWYYNRCTYASKLMEAGFNVLISFVITAVLVYLAFVLCNMTRITHYLALIVNFVACFYCGATVAALFTYSVMWGVLYALFVALPWLVTMCFCCFVCLCEAPICRSFCESARDSKALSFVLAIGLACKILTLFVILKILTMLI